MMPLIDVVFLLLTFFVFAMVLMVRLDVSDIRLPVGAAGDSPLERAPAITVTLSDEGELAVNGDPAEPDTIVQTLNELLQEQPDSPRVYCRGRHLVDRRSIRADGPAQIGRHPGSEFPQATRGVGVMPAPRAHDATEPPRLVFSLGLALSLLLHLGVGAWLLSSGVSLAGDRAGANTELFEKPDQVIELGEPDSDATTITWIGYREYEEHLARRSETEQALQTPDDTPSELINTPSLAPSAASAATAEIAAQPESNPEPQDVSPPIQEAALASAPEESSEPSPAPDESPRARAASVR